MVARSKYNRLGRANTAGQWHAFVTDCYGQTNPQALATDADDQSELAALQAYLEHFMRANVDELDGELTLQLLRTHGSSGGLSWTGMCCIAGVVLCCVKGKGGEGVCGWLFRAAVLPVDAANVTATANKQAHGKILGTT